MKSEQTQRHPQHVRAMRGQTRLTGFSFTIPSPHSSPAPLTSTSPVPSHGPSVVPSPVPSCGPSVAPSPVLLHVLSVMPSPVPSSGLSVAPSPVPSSVPSTSDPSPVPEELSQVESGSDSNGDIMGLGHKLDMTGPGGIDEEEEDIDDFMDTGGAEPKAKEEICNWKELQEQIKLDLAMAHK